mmetsp:Transcript_3511/g.7675  ORF Transcript_3511/g.7675 Transcript_3511/m.7675 type:complete len:211 (-) Transcript_3511:92-724(-)
MVDGCDATPQICSLRHRLFLGKVSSFSVFREILDRLLCCDLGFSEYPVLRADGLIPDRIPMKRIVHSQFFTRHDVSDSTIGRCVGIRRVVGQPSGVCWIRTKEVVVVVVLDHFLLVWGRHSIGRGWRRQDKSLPKKDSDFVLTVSKISLDVLLQSVLVDGCHAVCPYPQLGSLSYGFHRENTSLSFSVFRDIFDLHGNKIGRMGGEMVVG